MISGNRNRLLPAACIVLLLGAASLAQKAPDDCSWTSGSKLRPAVKLRTAADGASYKNYNDGRAITVAEWFAFTCGMDAQVPAQLPADKPVEGLETVRVTVRGYLLGARFERADDHDLHVELGASPEWPGDHVVLEMSAGAEYCAARRALWQLVRRDGCRGDQCILRRPVEVEVTGYVLLGSPQPGNTDYCHMKSTRGLRKGKFESQVRGLWRLQPVLAVKTVPAPKPRMHGKRSRRHA